MEKTNVDNGTKHPFCGNAFWASGDAEVTTHNFPSSAGFYNDSDTVITDDCSTNNHGWCLLYPTKASSGVTYNVTMKADPGTKSSTTLDIDGSSMRSHWDEARVGYVNGTLTNGASYNFVRP